MAKLVIEKWQCDWCKTILDAKPTHVGYPQCSLSYTVNWEWSGGNTSLTDICPECNEKLYKVIKEQLHGKG